MVNNAESGYVSNLVDFPREKWKKGGSDGNDGGNGMDDLKRRVERTEENIAQIKIDLATLTARSEHFATKSDTDALRITTQSEIHEVAVDLARLKSDLTIAINHVGSQLSGMEGSLKTKISEAITSQTKWMFTGLLAVIAMVLTFVKFAIH